MQFHPSKRSTDLHTSYHATIVASTDPQSTKPQIYIKTDDRPLIPVKNTCFINVFQSKKLKSYPQINIQIML